MSKNVKIILIIIGILAFLVIACVGGLTLLGYYFVDHEGVEKNEQEGSEFGKTTDNLGCQAKIVSRLKTIGSLGLNETLKARHYFRSCLESSRPSSNFCDGVPSDYMDILNEDRWKDADCARLGMKDSNPCRQVMKEKLDYCAAKR